MDPRRLKGRPPALAVKVVICAPAETNPTATVIAVDRRPFATPARVGRLERPFITVVIRDRATDSERRGLRLARSAVPTTLEEGTRCSGKSSSATMKS